MDVEIESDQNTSGSSNIFEEDVRRVLAAIRESPDLDSNTEEGDQRAVYEPAYSGSEPPVDLDQDDAALVFEQPTINMEIDLRRIQQPGFLSPVIILNNNLLVDPVPEAQATVEVVDEDHGGGSDGGDGRDEGDRVSTPTAMMAATMEGPIVLIEDTLRAELRQDGLAGPSAGRIVGDSPRNRKRRRTNTPSKATPPPASVPAAQYDDDDDGTICSICLDSWTLTGEHRLVSLKCGHLFGYMCIKRWLHDNPMQSRSCATCKTKAHLRDIRHLYAKAVKAVDNSEELRLKQQVDEEKLKVSKLAGELQVARMELEVQRTVASELRAKLKLYEQRGFGDYRANDASLMGEIANINKSFRNYKMALDKTIDLCRDPGCRVMVYGTKRQHLLVSQKSTQNLFPGYSIKFIDIPAFQYSSVLHVSSRMIRDISIDVEDELFTAATSERWVKLFSFNNRSVITFTPSDANVWSCAFDRERSKFLYLGTQSGMVYVYDIRNNNQYVEEFRTEGDCSPIINICPVSPTSSIPFGGFLVCKLTSCWFFEYTAAQRVESVRLNVDGPFTAMNYCEKTGYIMITTRPSSRHQRARYIIASLVKLESICALHIVQVITGSVVEPNMIRSAQVSLEENNTLVAAYLQDDRQLATWSTVSGKGNRLQTLPVSDVLWDLCPIYACNQTFLAALSDSKCRIYRAYSE
ncbi:E3 ubiquitin-protein ligase RFWD3 [Sabethes cyaneus]|uniref:E3 ubiquitin-protein ligase RFWD3 n=1 Tax=Sabethes cyaneus TaxID=53552 RepID=UPI00237D7DC0|nr:E3 ubiquitin-protein ligase RFWD3 [Sabethes cyaneus]XP_053685366.1 E3 ubiquitin-protein ligase RFWD3 [Sabethes cyaneus]